MHVLIVQRNCIPNDTDSVTYKKVHTKFHKDTIIDSLYHTKLLTDDEAVPAATFEVLLSVSGLTSDALLKVSTILSLSETEASLYDAMPKSFIGNIIQSSPCPRLVY